MWSRFTRLACLLTIAVAALPAPASAEASPLAVRSMSVLQHPASMPSAPTSLPFSLLAFALVGATEKAKTSKRNLSKTYLFNGESFGPGNDIEVPDGFPDIDGETGEPIHPPGSIAERNQRASKRLNFTSPPNTGGVNTGESSSGNEARTVSGLTQAEIAGMTKSELADHATSQNITVDRRTADGTVEEGEPLVGDYRRVLGATSK